VTYEEEPIETMTFGKHKGIRLEEIPDSYIQWLVREVGLTPQLRKGFEKAGKDVEMVMSFGKHKDDKVNDLPKNYIDWMNDVGVLDERPALKQRLQELGKIAPDEGSEEESLSPFNSHYAGNLVFIDLEAVRTSVEVNNISASHIVQLGAVDGLGRRFEIDIRPPITWDQLPDDPASKNFFIDNGFENFFDETRELPTFQQAWPLILKWMKGEDTSTEAKDPALKKGIRVCDEGATRNPDHPVLLIAHYGINYDFPMLQEEVRRIGEPTDFLHNPFSCMDSFKVLQANGKRNVDRPWSLFSLHSRATNTVLENHHTALADSEALKAVFEKDVVFNNIFQHAVVERMRTLS